MVDSLWYPVILAHGDLGQWSRPRNNCCQFNASWFHSWFQCICLFIMMRVKFCEESKTEVQVLTSIISHYIRNQIAIKRLILCKSIIYSPSLILISITLIFINKCVILHKNSLLSPAAPKARDGRYCNAPRPSVRLSVRPSVPFSFRTVTQKRIDVFSRNFAGMCTMSWGCAV